VTPLKKRIISGMNKFLNQGISPRSITPKIMKQGDQILVTKESKLEIQNRAHINTFNREIWA
jgi:hypothetical protein